MAKSPGMRRQTHPQLHSPCTPFKQKQTGGRRWKTLPQLLHSLQASKAGSLWMVAHTTAAAARLQPPFPFPNKASWLQVSRSRASAAKAAAPSRSSLGSQQNSQQFWGGRPQGAAQRNDTERSCKGKTMGSEYTACPGYKHHTGPALGGGGGAPKQAKCQPAKQ